MNLEQVWKHVNVSTLLVLPLFDDITMGVKTRLKPQIGFPFLLVAYEYGLINSYLFRNNDAFNGRLYAAFQSIVQEDQRLTSSDYYSLNEQIIDSVYCIEAVESDDRVIYELKIPEEFIEDVHLIIEGKYSKVSRNYKEHLRIKQRFIPKWKSLLAHYICKENIPYSIVSKAKHLKVEMEIVMDTVFSSDQEFYIRFSQEKETVYY